MTNSSSHPAGRPRMPRPRILVVDADNATRRAEARLATRAQCNVDTVRDLAAAWRTLCGKHYDLLIASTRLMRHCGNEFEWWLHDAGVTVPVILTRGMVPVGVINPSGQPASWFAKVGRQHFRPRGLVRLVREILGAVTAQPQRGAPVAA